MRKSSRIGRIFRLARLPVNMQAGAYCNVVRCDFGPNWSSASVNAGIVSLIVFVVVMAGVFVGTALQRALPKHHLSDDSNDMVKIGAGFIATLAALVLGLLVASATTSFNAKSDEVERSAAKIILVDRNLRQYGNEATPVRLLLRDALIAKAKITWVEQEAEAATRGTALAPCSSAGDENLEHSG